MPQRTDGVVVGSGARLAALLTFLLFGQSVVAADTAPVRVFILAGQSNMEGKAPNALYEHQATDPATRDQFSHLRRDGKWIVRDDVFIRFLNRKGPLTLGYGSPDRTGVELELGTVLGDHFQEPVLLIKTAWGGHSLVKNFRPPSAGFPPDAVLAAELTQARQRIESNNQKNGRSDPLPELAELKQQYGASYRMMLNEVRETLDRCDELFPELKGRPRVVSGFFWFQGWNDQYGGQDEYASNLTHLIRDIRKDLGVPQLPVVIAAMGQNGSKPAQGAMRTVQQAQLSMNDVAEFHGTVRSIRTDTLVDQAAEQLYPQWKERLEDWKNVGGDHPYHYLGSALWMNRIGAALGTTMLDLLKSPPGQN